jgi:hypothetical protein
LIESFTKQLAVAGFSAKKLYKNAQESRILEEDKPGGFDLKTSGYFADLALAYENHQANGQSGIKNLLNKATT